MIQQKAIARSIEEMSGQHWTQRTFIQYLGFLKDTDQHAPSDPAQLRHNTTTKRLLQTSNFRITAIQG
jgi:hypothetical protein